ncbi:class III lanthionine synthetase LanKC [Streptomyces candidus]|uniref:non-specific serine/threonine protein kinase n=1 Tax=Streptomyces candidus TaxID=67283 RepID=A0A7X0HE37_9ACTN|nr:class III lanthionine synthetase LanKC [Streptomyces candidus]MBB6435858.1 tRNA A-37 threonylcarbamoyl transferase component Bud32 [Streptomyces candidus]GHH42730.1 serine/threonine protein kinase [Streptomyces candidus]
MNKGYAVFCDADRHFYDAPHRMSADAHGGRNALYAAATRPVPEGWQRHRSGDWLALRPATSPLPAQGWKIHVSATLDNAESVLERVAEYCVPRGVAFKFVPSRYLLHTRNAKYADRSASGKFVTVYPADDEQCRTVATDLDALLAGEPGPYILSDLRWGRGPVHLRYGSFTRRHCYDERGELCPALENAEGVLVPDVRGPVFRTPEWVEFPEWLKPHLEARAEANVADLPYVFEKALHFSNGGGVYAGTDRRTGAKVVLKEARPYAGLAADGADAVARLRREQVALERLSGLGCTPEVLDSFVLGEHHFLVLEFVEGKPLNSFFARRHPLIEADPGPERLAEYTEWALRIHALVTDAVAAVHARGVVFNDLHLFNIMVSEDESSVVLLDFEAAAPAAENRRQTVANPAFVAPADRRGFDVDRYALACLRLALFIPLTSLFALDRGKSAHLAQIAARQFPVAESFLREAVEEICRDPQATPPASGNGPDAAKDTATTTVTAPAIATAPATEAAEPYLPVEPGDWPASRDSLAGAITASATPGRTDRLFPGDIAQFATAGGGQSFGYGAAGVLYALTESGAGRFAAGEEWLLARTKEPDSGTPLGFYDGLAGIAWTLERLGHRARALELAELALGQPWEALSPDLHSGLAGLGLALEGLAAATGEHTLHDAALRCADLLVRPNGGAPDGRAPRAGLLYGATGSALLFLRLYERTGDAALLDHATDALRRDLDRCVRSASGTLQVDEGWRTMPYLGAGSVGIGAVLDDHHVHRPDHDGPEGDFARARRDIVSAAQATFYAQPGLFRGAAGMVLHLSRTTTGGPGTGPADVRRQIDTLAWHAVPHQGRLAFPGEQMMRLSMDLATGSAGCLLALAAASGLPTVEDRPAQLPFLPPLRRPQNRPDTWAVQKEIVPSERKCHEHS